MKLERSKVYLCVRCYAFVDWVDDWFGPEDNDHYQRCPVCGQWQIHSIGKKLATACDKPDQYIPLYDEWADLARDCDVP